MGFEQELLAHDKMLHFYARKWMYREADQDDLVQATFEQALKIKARYVLGTNMKSWLYSIIYNEYRHWCYYHENKWKFTLDDMSEQEQEHYTTDYRGDPAPKVINKLYLKWLLDQLPQIYRDAIILVFVRDMNYEQAGRYVGVTEGAMDHRINRARRQLHAIKRQGDTT